MKLFALLITILLSVSCNGSRTEEFVTYVRSADELFRQGKDEEAMNALVKAIDSYSEGTDIFLASGDTLNYCNALLLLCDACILNLDASRAHKCISIMQENARFYHGQSEHAYHLCQIKLTELQDGAEAAVPLIDAYLANLPASAVCSQWFMTPS